MTLEKLKEIVEDKFDMNLSIKNRKREITYAKRVFITLAYNHSPKFTFQRIGDVLGLKHDNVLYHYNRFDVVYDNYKMLHDEILTQYNLNGRRKFIPPQEVVMNKINDMLRQLNEKQLTDFVETRIKPYVRMHLKNN